MPSQPVFFETETAVRYQFELEEFDAARGARRILVVKFSGAYRPGCQGTPDALFIQGITLAGLKVWGPDALILDLRQLSYTWGDNMEEVLGLREEIEVPFAIVGSESCLPAIGTLLQAFYGPEKIKAATDAENIFDNMGAALEYVHHRV